MGLDPRLDLGLPRGLKTVKKVKTQEPGFLHRAWREVEGLFGSDDQDDEDTESEAERDETEDAAGKAVEPAGRKPAEQPAAGKPPAAT